MRETARLALILAITAGFCGALLVAVAGRTAAARGAVAQRRLEASMSSLFGGAAADGATFRKAGDGDAYALLGGAGEFLGAALVAESAHGYGGAIRLLVAFDAAGRLLDFAVLESHETPGLGSRIAQDGFRAGFRGRLSGGAWKLRKDGGDIDAVTSATISSRAATEAVADAASRFASMRDGFARGQTTQATLQDK